jgi:DnaJ-class molecular chaperone
MFLSQQSNTDCSDHYEVLQVPRSASRNEIKASFHRLALIHHPDRNSSPSATETYRRIQLAWECLGGSSHDDDNESRKVYDRELQNKEYKSQAKENSSIALKLSELEEAVEEETNGFLYLYTCRCGHEVILDDQEMQSRNPLLVECQGCSIVYSILR